MLLQERERGVVKLEVWLRLFGLIGMPMGVSFFVFLILSNVATFAQTWWLSQWASEAYGGGKEATWLYTGVYSGLAVVGSVFVLARALTTFLGFLNTSYVLHRRVIGGVMASPMSFFNTTPTGRVLNRFSKELAQDDQGIAGPFGGTFLNIVRSVGNVYFMVVGSSPYLLIAFVPLAAAFFWAQQLQ